MKIWIATLASASPYYQSRDYSMEVERTDGESHDDFERRTWMLRTHADADGQIYIPADQFQRSIQGAAQYANERIPERGRETWTKHFNAGITVPDPIILPDRRDSVQGTWLRMSPQGRRDGGTRVSKRMPFISSWAGDLTIWVLDPLINEDILSRVITDAGLYVGIGQHRPQMRGGNGRYRLVKLAEQREPGPARLKVA
jgi:hypothetical protein